MAGGAPRKPCGRGGLAAFWGSRIFILGLLLLPGRGDASAPRGKGRGGDEGEAHPRFSPRGRGVRVGVPRDLQGQNECGWGEGGGGIASLGSERGRLWAALPPFSPIALLGVCPPNSPLSEGPLSPIPALPGPGRTDSVL